MADYTELDRTVLATASASVTDYKYTDPINEAIIIDNDDSECSLSGLWGDGVGGYDSAYKESSDTSATAVWTFSDLHPGYHYRISATWVADAGNSTEAIFEVIDCLTSNLERTSLTETINQQNAPSQRTIHGAVWDDFSETILLRGRQLKVKLSSSGSDTIVADAVYIQKVGRYVPPIGLKTPWGVEVSVYRYTDPQFEWDYGAGLEPYKVDATGRPYTHWIEPDHPSASDTNTFGTSTNPRNTIPTTVTEGSVVLVVGDYATNRTTTHQGTRDKPVFIRGQDPVDRTNFKLPLYNIGTYYIIEHFHFQPHENEVNYGKLIFYSGSSHGVGRHNELTGCMSGGGISFTGCDYCVTYNNVIHDMGDWLQLPEDDTDKGGAPISSNVTYCWELDNDIYHCAGSCIQINPDSFDPAVFTQTNHIFIGRNIGHDTWQTPFWVKLAVDIVFTENISYNVVDTRYGGGGVGFQYAPERIWFIFNEVFNAENGLVSGANDYGTGEYIYIIGNVFHDIKLLAYRVQDIDNPQYNYDGGIKLVGGVYRYIYCNTIYNCDNGIDLAAGDDYYLANNIVSKITMGFHVRQKSWATVDIDNCIFYEHQKDTEPRFADDNVDILNLSEYAALASVSVDNTSIVNPLFIDDFALDFTPQNDAKGTSPAINNGISIQSTLDEYESLYGVAIDVDINRTPRDYDTNVAIGAIETPTYETGDNVYRVYAGAEISVERPTVTTSMNEDVTVTATATFKVYNYLDNVSSSATASVSATSNYRYNENVEVTETNTSASSTDILVCVDNPIAIATATAEVFDGTYIDDVTVTSTASTYSSHTFDTTDTTLATAVATVAVSFSERLDTYTTAVGSASVTDYQYENPLNSPIIIDDSDTEFSTTGVWTPSAGGYAPNYQLSTATDATATWTFSNLCPGYRYRISVTWVELVGNCSSAKYTIVNPITDEVEKTLSSETIDQTVAPSGFSYGGTTWQTLEDTVLVRSRDLQITLTNTSGSDNLVADAIYIQRIGSYVPPIGLKAPWGIEQTHWVYSDALHQFDYGSGLVAYSMGANGPYTHYVHRGHGSDTDVGNPYGTPSTPRKTIPSSIPAGSIVEIHGTLDYTSADVVVTCSGTAEQPIFIRGASQSDMPFIGIAYYFKGSHFIVENIEVGASIAYATEIGRILIYGSLGTTHHAVARWNESSGATAILNNGIGTVVFASPGAVENAAFYNNLSHGFGDWVGESNTVDAISLERYTNNIWIIDNKLYNNSGNSISISGNGAVLQLETNNIFVGRNAAFDNWKSPFRADICGDVIFTENTAHGTTDDGGTEGGILCERNPDTIWAMFNEIYDCENGIVFWNDIGGTGVDSYIIGNVIYNCQLKAGHTQTRGSTDFYVSAILLDTQTDREIHYNTIYDCDGGITAPDNNNYTISNNIISEIDNAYYVYQADNSQTMTMSNCAFYQEVGTPDFGIETDVYDMTDFSTNMDGSLTNCYVEDPQFANTVTQDFTVESDSDSFSGTSIQSIWDTYESSYGVAVTTDINRITKDYETSPIIGALAAPPAPPRDDASADATATVTIVDTTSDTEAITELTATAIIIAEDSCEYNETVLATAVATITATDRNPNLEETELAATATVTVADAVSLSEAASATATSAATVVDSVAFYDTGAASTITTVTIVDEINFLEAPIATTTASCFTSHYFNEVFVTAIANALVTATCSLAIAIRNKVKIIKRSSTSSSKIKTTKRASSSDPKTKITTTNSHTQKIDISTSHSSND